jgi:3-oxoacyl-ACP reductase-like protein
MGLLATLMGKILGKGAPSTQSTTTAQPPAGGSNPPVAVNAPAGASAPPPSAPPPVVDVTAILDGLASKNPEKLDWRKSIVDLMKLVGMDSSLSARIELAKELHYTGNTNDSATMNIWLHKTVIQKISENGGKVPQELLKF